MLYSCCFDQDVAPPKIFSLASWFWRQPLPIAHCSYWRHHIETRQIQYLDSWRKFVLAPWLSQNCVLCSIFVLILDFKPKSSLQFFWFNEIYSQIIDYKWTQFRSILYWSNSEYWSQKRTQNGNIHSSKLDVYAEKQSVSNLSFILKNYIMYVTEGRLRW